MSTLTANYPDDYLPYATTARRKRRPSANQPVFRVGSPYTVGSSLPYPLYASSRTPPPPPIRSPPRCANRYTFGQQEPTRSTCVSRNSLSAFAEDRLVEEEQIEQHNPRSRLSRDVRENSNSCSSVDNRSASSSETSELQDLASVLGLDQPHVHVLTTAPSTVGGCSALLNNSAFSTLDVHTAPSLLLINGTLRSHGQFGKCVQSVAPSMDTTQLRAGTFGWLHRRTQNQNADNVGFGGLFDGGSWSSLLSGRGECGRWKCAAMLLCTILTLLTLVGVISVSLYLGALTSWSKSHVLPLAGRFHVQSGDRFEESLLTQNNSVYHAKALKYDSMVNIFIILIKSK